jgi:hypothetical protein
MKERRTGIGLSADRARFTKFSLKLPLSTKPVPFATATLHFEFRGRRMWPILYQMSRKICNTYKVKIGLIKHYMVVCNKSFSCCFFLQSGMVHLQRRDRSKRYIFHAMSIGEHFPLSVASILFLMKAQVKSSVLSFSSLCRQVQWASWFFEASIRLEWWFGDNYWVS